MPPIVPELAAALDGFDDPAILLSRDYRILAANRAYRQLYPWRGEVVGDTCYRVSHHFDLPCDQCGETCPLQTSLESGEARRTLHLHHSPQGREHVDVETIPLPDGAGGYACCIEIHRHARVAATQPGGALLVGISPAFNRMLELVQRVAPTQATVLLLGESGTGKELVARALHEASNRAGGPLVPVDCSGLTESLFESELFGHEKGAFTGAYARKTGLVEAAQGGTLFLDELGDIPLSLQVKLLRLLETGSYRRVGGADPLEARFRLICATHRDLTGMLARGEFRQDLYYRISAFPIRLPPLRERREDLPLLAETLLHRIFPEQTPTLTPAALRCLEGYPFPGNIRELRNLLERAGLLSDSGVIRPEHLPAACRPSTLDEPDWPAGGIVPLAEAERRYLRWAVATYRGDRASLAAALGLGERTLYRKLQSLGLAGR